MTDIVSIGSLTLDMFFRDDSLAIKDGRFSLAVGGKYVAETFKENVGGGGGNVAVGLCRLGFTASLWAELGTDSTSHVIARRLEKERVDMSIIEWRDEFSHISAVLLTAKGERTIITHKSHEAIFHFTPERVQAVKSARLLYLGNMPDMALSMREEVVDVARSSDVKIAVNLGVKDCRLGIAALSKILSACDYLILNRYEVADLLTIPSNELLLKEVNYKERIGMKDDAVLVVTDGELGSYAQSKEGIHFQEALKVDNVINTAGAGDAFTTGFVASMLMGKTIVEALSNGAKNSASVIQVIGAQDGLLRAF